MKISVFGAGYVGLVTATCLADVGHDVCCVDVDVDKVEGLNRGRIPIYEPGLEAMVLTNTQEDRLTFTTDAPSAVRFADLIFIAVGTPSAEGGSADLTHAVAVARAVGEHIESHKVVAVKSTVPVGTSDHLKAVIAEGIARRGAAVEFDVCSNPEFLKEGSAIGDFVRPDRIVIGSDSPVVMKRMRECYAPYNRNHDRLMFMSVRSAELTKYAANAMLATRISLMNEIANLAERVSADIEEVRHGIGADPRIGYHFIYPGCGYGGSCFPKDVRALVNTAAEFGLDAGILSAVEAVNNRQKQTLFAKLSHAFDGRLRGRVVAVWGLAFKPNTDDMRDAPSRSLMEALWREGAVVRAFDPEAMGEARRIYGERGDLVLAASREDAVAGADALVICTEWKQFRVVDFAWLKKQLRTPVVIDGRNLFDPKDLRERGFRYYAVGRGETSVPAIAPQPQNA